MAQFETWLHSDLKEPVKVEKLPGSLFSADNSGNLIGVEIFDNGEPANISGGVQGYAIRADGKTVMINGTLDRNKASIVLPASAYIAVGPISIVIKVGTMTVGACTGTVFQSTTDDIIDPGHEIPSLAELLAHINDAIQAATNANNAATNANAQANAAETAAANAESKAGLADTAAASANEAATNANAKAALADTAATNANTQAEAAQTAAGNVNTAIHNAETATTNANNAASLANTKAGLADTAAENANTKAGLADTAATNANTKAGLADMAATNANTKAGLADTAATNANTAASNAQTAADNTNAAIQKIDGMTVDAEGLPEGSDLTATISEVNGHKHIDFGIPKGDTGETGPRGNSIDNITFNQDNTANIILEDGTTFVTPPIKGDKGDPGVNAMTFSYDAATEEISIQITTS